MFDFEKALSSAGWAQGIEADMEEHDHHHEEHECHCHDDDCNCKEEK